MKVISLALLTTVLVAISVTAHELHKKKLTYQDYCQGEKDFVGHPRACFQTLRDEISNKTPETFFIPSSNPNEFAFLAPGSFETKGWKVVLTTPDERCVHIELTPIKENANNNPEKSDICHGNKAPVRL
ncbi:uncharacterized protein UTRI_04995_B [Ustilago trichophora]|uniref:Uncharacterized protein n=1 Tax=Ustilago trichophora TaxID=86804 RepID=A0A5C3EFX5_9BASI|nr:uncharacterized protein UTRI_04995_B [Ustilago trichophora]